MTLSLWLTFLGMALAASLSPGPGVLLAISTTLTHGARRTAFSSAGNATGVFMVACVAASGVGLLLQHSLVALTALKIAGAAYLAWLGLKQWSQAQRGGHAALVSSPRGASRRAVFRRGMLVACSNPKAILFFAAVFPQFMPPGEAATSNFLLLSLSFVACTFISHFAYVLLVAWAGLRLFEGQLMARLQRGTGALLILLATLMLMQ